MIVSKPRFNTIFALSIFLVLVFGSFFLLLDSLLSNESYFIVKLILTPITLVIALLVLGKLLGAIKIVKAGNNRLDIFFPISRSRIDLPLEQIKGWREDVVKTKQGEFRETKIVYGNKKVIKLSNKENTEYKKLLKYLNQKAKKQKAS
jgi:hypothetical protein